MYYAYTALLVDYSIFFFTSNKRIRWVIIIARFFRADNWIGGAR